MQCLVHTFDNLDAVMCFVVVVDIEFGTVMGIAEVGYMTRIAVDMDSFAGAGYMTRIAVDMGSFAGAGYAMRIAIDMG